jgi:histidine ammonia-lyase
MMLLLNGYGLTPIQVVQVARYHLPVQLAEEAAAAMSASVELRDHLLANAAEIYGVTTGFGDNCDRSVAPTYCC